MDPGPIWLIGMMGSGKTTVAPLAAAKLGWGWLDTDAEVQARSGSTIPELFDASEAAFRVVERRVLEEAAGTRQVVATGGGAVTIGTDVLTGVGFSVWLRAQLATLLARIGDGDDVRPLLRPDPEAALRELAGERAELYAGVADVVVDTDALDPGKVAEVVVEEWLNSLSGE